LFMRKETYLLHSWRVLFVMSTLDKLMNTRLAGNNMTELTGTSLVTNNGLKQHSLPRETGCVITNMRDVM